MVTWIGAGLVNAGPLNAEPEGLQPPAQLRCEYFQNPLGFDLIPPRLSWEVQDDRRGARQSAYRIQVASEMAFGADGMVWDSGKVESNQSAHVVYDGPPLTSRQRLYWRVRTWDGDDQVSPWSAVSWWETGLLDAADWSARWIAPPKIVKEEEELPWGSWIWHEKVKGSDTNVYMRLPFEIPADRKLDAAILNMTVDDDFEIFVNGERLGDRGGWKIVHTFKLAKYLSAGKNVVAVRAHNTHGPGAMIATLRLRDADGRTQDITSGAETWKAHTEPTDGWTTAAFDDRGWRAAHVVAKYGDAPWHELKVNEHEPRASYMLRRAFTLDKPVRRARAYVTGLGLYELHLNGAKVGEDIFTPGWTDYGQRLQYQTYDVTDRVHQGENAVGAMLGNGWWASGLGGDWRHLTVYADQDNPQFLLQLEIEYTDGTRDAILTDGKWTSHLSPITENTFYHGEHHDARLEQPGWSTTDFDAGDWSAVEEISNPPDLLVAQRSPAIQVTEVLEPMMISEPDPGVYIIDFGQNASGWMQIRVRGDKGDRIQLRFGEELDPNGRLYRENYRSARATDIYICKGEGEEVWEPRFTYRGFRYAEVTGWPQEDKEHPKPPSADAFLMKVVHTASAPAGEFACSNDLINRIHDAIRWGLRSNMHSVPTDCPQRDERLGWTGDAQAFAITACYLMDTATFWSKWMKDLADAQSPEGFVTDVAPAAVTRGAAKPGWGDAVVIVPWVVYRHYGDTRIIEDNYATIRGWVEYMRSQSKNGLYEVEGYGDWVAPVKTNSAPIGSLYYYHSTDLLARMAEVIGREDDARTYRELADSIAAAFHEKHFDSKTNNYWDGTQTANILPLWFGVVPERHRADVLANLIDDIRGRGYRLSTGFLGTPYLMPLLSAMEADETAWRLAVQTNQPSWGYMILNGATTIWERWDSDKHGPSMNSRNHFAFGVVGQWYYQALAGIQLDPNVPGFQRMIIRPETLGDLDWVRASVPTMYGNVRVHWSRGAKSLRMDVTIPANTTAAVHVPLCGHGTATVREGETVLVENGKAKAPLPHIQPRGTNNKHARFDVAAGMYRFEVTWD